MTAPDGRSPDRETFTISTLAAAAAPGALAGTQVAGLLFFLNPHLPFGTLPVLRGVAFFSLLLAGSSLLFFLLFLRKNPEKARRWLPWSLTVVLAASALGAWTHASYYAFFLPAGINRRLVKAGIWLTLAAVICFYTALIHQLKARPYSRRTRVLLTLLSLASIYVVMERREAFKPDLGPGPRPSMFQGSPRPQLMVVGIEAATLDTILPLAEQGRLPFFNKMLTQGSRSRMTSLHPVGRKSLWSTLASGKYSFPTWYSGASISSLHGSLAAMNSSVSFRSVSGSSIGVHGARRFQSNRATGGFWRLWEILARLEISSALVGWPLSSLAPGKEPHERIEVGLSESFFQGSADEGSVWPAEIAERAMLFRSRRSDVLPARTSRFGDSPPDAVLDALVEDLWRQDLAFFLLEQDLSIDALFLLLPGLSKISGDYFGGYSAVRFAGEQNQESENAARLVAAYYMQLDEFLARLWERSREPRLLTVVSVHGAEEARGWRKAWQILARQPPLKGYVDRGPDGLLIFMGDAVRAEPRMGSAELVDLVPTLLYGLSFPIASDLDGAVLTNTFETSFLARQPLTFLPSYETFAGPGKHADDP